MERESLLTVLIILWGGLLLQSFGFWSFVDGEEVSPRHLERRYWLRLWAPIVPALIAAAWLCGWALSEPDPVPDRLGQWGLLAGCAPFAILLVRALARAAWSLLREPDACGVFTIGLLRPKIVFSPVLAKQLDERALNAALEHERAHARHRDPLRVWLAQFITDLQWPWPAAQRRLQAWLNALEYVRDDEARTHGVDGADLAAAVLAAVRFHRVVFARQGTDRTGRTPVRLIGETSALRERVARLLAPQPEYPQDAALFWSIERVGLLLIPALLSALVLGDRFGECILRPLLAMTS